jgi:hypothetical protein
VNQQDGHNQDELSIAALLRLAADGELNEGQDVALRAHLETHPEDRDRVEFDRKLREACRCACTPECCAPQSLHERVRAECCEGGLTDRMQARAEETRDRGFWAARVVTRFGAVAALIALVAVVAFMVGRTGTIPPNGPGEVVEAHDMVERVARFVRREHDRCADSPLEFDPKFTIQEVEQVPERFASLMGQSLSPAAILAAGSSGLQFVDAGPCNPPSGIAMHFRFRTDDPDAGLVSVWAQVDDGSMDIKDGITYTCSKNIEDGFAYSCDMGGCNCIRFWRAEGVRYVLVCPDPGTASAASLALGCPAERDSH